MLSIKPIGSSQDEVGYYANLGDAENHDYYSEDGVRPGVWWGEALDSLGLGGAVSPAVFKNLLEGLSPAGEKPLVQRQGGKRSRRAGFDLTFSLPKSFSAVWSQAGDDDRQRLDTVAEQALHRTLDVVQDLCGWTRRGKGSLIAEKAKLFAAVFSHDTARGVKGVAPDANRHFHVVVPNVVVRDDGTTGTLDARVLFTRRMKMALGAAYRSEVTKLLKEELGMATYRPLKEGREEHVSWFELAGVPQSLLKAMSKRRTAIEVWLREHGLAGAKSAEKAALATRSKKERYTWRQLNEAWQRLGLEWGFGLKQAQALFGTPRKLTKEQKGRAGQEAVRRALERLLAHQARFTRNELLEATAVEAQCRGIGIDEISVALSNELHQSKEVVRLQDKETVPSFTTKVMLQLEETTIDRAVRLNNRSGHFVAFAVAAEGVANYPTLKPEQVEAVTRCTTGPDLVSITGVAGTGKTFMLNVVREILQQQGYRVQGTALAAKAAKGLQTESHIPSTHIGRLLYQVGRGQVVLDEKTVLIIDEAGTVGTEHMATLLELVESAGAKALLVGDERQLQAVAAGAPFRKISDSIGTTEMTEIVRQHESWARSVVQDLRGGRAEQALAVLDERGQLFIEAEKEASFEKLVEQWEALAFTDEHSLKETLVVAGMTADVRELNRRLQVVMRERGQLGDYAIELDGLNFHLGDRVMVTKNSSLYGVENGSLGEVTGVSGTRLWLKLDEGFEVEIETTEFDKLTLALAMSCHKAQGVTSRNALVITGDTMTDRELSYVAGSRAKERTVFLTHEAAVEGIEGLAEMMNRSRQNEMAMEHRLEEAG